MRKRKPTSDAPKEGTPQAGAPKTAHEIPQEQAAGKGNIPKTISEILGRIQSGKNTEAGAPSRTDAPQAEAPNGIFESISVSLENVIKTQELLEAHRILKKYDEYSDLADILAARINGAPIVLHTDTINNAKDFLDSNRIREYREMKRTIETRGDDNHNNLLDEYNTAHPRDFAEHLPKLKRKIEEFFGIPSSLPLMEQLDEMGKSFQQAIRDIEKREHEYTRKEIRIMQQLEAVRILYKEEANYHHPTLHSVMKISENIEKATGGEYKQILYLPTKYGGYSSTQALVNALGNNAEELAIARFIHKGQRGRHARD